MTEHQILMDQIVINMPLNGTLRELELKFSCGFFHTEKRKYTRSCSQSLFAMWLSFGWKNDSLFLEQDCKGPFQDSERKRFT